MTDQQIPLPKYGVWIPGQGWLKGARGVYADLNKAVAKEIAKRIGKGARVYFVDEAIADLEQVLILAEKEREFPRLKFHWR